MANSRRQGIKPPIKPSEANTNLPSGILSQRHQPAVARRTIKKQT